MKDGSKNSARPFALPSGGARLPSLRHADAGMTLIEILIALFIFMVGALGIFSVIPVSMDQATRALDNRRGIVIAQHALASLRHDLGGGAPLFTGRVAAGSTSVELMVVGDFAWPEDKWEGAYATVTFQDGAVETRPVTGNLPGPDTLYVSPPFTSAPEGGDRLLITRHYQGWVDVASGNTLTAVGAPGWDAADGGEWAEWCVVLLSGTGAGQARRIASNTADTLTLAKDWTTIPDATARFRIAPTALNSEFAGSPRSGTVASVVDATTLESDVEVGIENDDLADGDYFLLITSGRARGRVCEVTGRTGTQITTADVDFVNAGVRAGDTFVVLGNSSGIYSFPGNSFGTPDADPPQTARDPSDPDSDYSYAAIYSDPAGLDRDAFSPVRVDILVFRIYNNALPPGENRRAAFYQTAYIKQP